VIKEWNDSLYKIIAVGRKGRKTTFDINELFFNAMTDEQGLTYPFIGPTRTQAKKIVWEDHIEKILNLCDDNNIEYNKNKSELSIRFPGYGKVTVDGSDNIESLRGKSDWGGVVMDEFASWKNKRYAWEDVIEPNLVVHNAWAIVSGTPKGYEYFHLLMKMGDHVGKIEGDAWDDDGNLIKPNKDFISYRYTSYNNPFVNHTWIDGRKDRLTETAFKQEYLARFEKFTGLIYKEFTRDIHVIEPFNIPVGWYRYAGVDFGAENPTVYLWIAIDRDDKIYIYDEYYQAGKDTEFHANVIKAKSENKVPVTVSYGDPSGTQEILDFANQNVYITPAVKILTTQHEQGWVRSGIDKVQQLLKKSRTTGKPNIFIFNNCLNTIKEFESYRWLEHKNPKDEDLNERDMPLKANDHCMDALRYFVVSHFSSTPIGDKILEEE